MRKIAGLFAVFISLMLVAPCFAYALPPVTNGLVGCWKFDEGSGVTAVDSSSNGNNGVIVNQTYSTDTISQSLSSFSLRFNTTQEGYAYSYVTIPDSPSLRPSSGLTLAAWVKTDTYHYSVRHIISKQYGDGASDSYMLYYYSGNLVFVFQSGVGGVWSIQTGTPTDNVWHHIVATYDMSSMRLYVDGVEKTSMATTESILYDNKPVLIGADCNNAEHISDEGWDGFIDEVLIYNRALSQAEIMQVMPEFPSVLTLSLFMSATIIVVIVYTKRIRKQANLSFS
jgi:hypothetical protein